MGHFRTKNIVYETRKAWVYAHEDDYTVYLTGITVSKPDCSFERTVDGLSLAVARCNYHAAKGTQLTALPVMMKQMEDIHNAHIRTKKR